MSHMTIGKAAKKAGVGIETIRFYERRQLIQRPQTPRGGGYRHYPAATIERIRFVRQAQELGFSLNEIDELPGFRADPKADSAQVRTHALAKLSQVEEKMHQLERIRAALKTLIAACPGQGAVKSCSILGAMSSAGCRV